MAKQGSRWELDGPRILREAISSGRVTVAELATKLGKHRNAVYLWASGERRPSSEEVRRALGRLIGAPLDSWSTAAELAEDALARSA